ncbi:MAG: SDR family NAD(P)-dependent oxidoreductase [Ignavibacteriota bacterium]
MNIIITGASKGIGFAAAEAFGRQSMSHTIGICSRTSDMILQSGANLQKAFPAHRFFAKACDVSREAEVRSFVSEFEEKFGTVDILINNAGFGIFNSVVEMSKGEFESVISTNLRGVFLMSKAVLPGMRQKRTGTIITIASLAGKNGFKGGSAYTASKWAVRGLMQCLFLEVRADNIRVATIFPGSVDTDFFTANNPAGSMKANNALSAHDIAACIELITHLPQGADVSEIDIRPTNPKG